MAGFCLPAIHAGSGPETPAPRVWLDQSPTPPSLSQTVQKTLNPLSLLQTRPGNILSGLSRCRSPAGSEPHTSRTSAWNTRVQNILHLKPRAGRRGGWSYHPHPFPRRFWLRPKELEWNAGIQVQNECWDRVRSTSHTHAHTHTAMGANAEKQRESANI